MQKEHFKVNFRTVRELIHTVGFTYHTLVARIVVAHSYISDKRYRKECANGRKQGVLRLVFLTVKYGAVLWERKRCYIVKQGVKRTADKTCKKSAK